LTYKKGLGHGGRGQVSEGRSRDIQDLCIYCDLDVEISYVKRLCQCNFHIRLLPAVICFKKLVMSKITEVCI
jgi:hypothetical protein